MTEIFFNSIKMKPSPGSIATSPRRPTSGRPLLRDPHSLRLSRPIACRESNRPPRLGVISSRAAPNERKVLDDFTRVQQQSRRHLAPGTRHAKDSMSSQIGRPDHDFHVRRNEAMKRFFSKPKTRHPGVCAMTSPIPHDETSTLTVEPLK